jgi:hypothetical protein
MTKQKNFLAVLFSGAAILAVAVIPHGKGGLDSDVENAPALNRLTKQTKRSLNEAASLDDLNRLTRQRIVVQLINSLKMDELNNRQVFNELSAVEPLVRVVTRGILSYERKTFRTPEYRKEAGYDLVTYEIYHPLGGVSKIMAYLDKPISDDETSRIARVVVLTGQDGQTQGDLVQFEGKDLKSQASIPWLEGKNLFDREMLNASALMRASVE